MQVNFPLPSDLLDSGLAHIPAWLLCSTAPTTPPDVSLFSNTLCCLMRAGENRK